MKNLLSTNIYDPDLKEKFLIVGTCIPAIQSDVYKRFEKEWGTTFGLCLEQFHYNQMHSKLAAILGTGNTKKVGFLSVDGSPHCVQMHYVSKYLQRELKQPVEYEHYVLDPKGNVYQVDMAEIDKAKALARVGKQINFVNY